MALATDVTAGEIQLTGDLAGDGGAQIGSSPQLTHISGLTPGQYINPKVTVDAKGRVTAIVAATPTEIGSTLPPATASTPGVVSVGSNLNITTSPTQGIQVVDFGGNITGSPLPASGLDSCGTFSVDIQVDGANTYTITNTGANLTDGQVIVDQINTDVTGAVASIVGGNIQIQSNTIGRGSTIDILNDSLFQCMTNFVELDTAIDGTDTCELYVNDGSTSVKGVVQIGSGINVTDGVISVNLAELPIATDSVLGGVTVPTSGHIDVDVAGNISIPLATESSLGLMQVGNGLDVDVNGVVSVDLTETGYAYATESSAGIVQIGAGLDVTGGVVSVDLTEVAYVDATESSKGIMQVGTGLDVSAGVVSVDLTEVTYQDATVAQKGIVQIGSNINVASGVISVDTATESVKGIVQGGDGIDITAGVASLEIASPTNLGGVKIGSGLTIDGAGLLSTTVVPDATYSSKGILQVTANTGLDLTSGVLSGINASDSVKGVITVGNNIDVASGVISVPDATTTVKGVMTVPGGDGLVVSGGSLSFNYTAATDTTLGAVKVPTASIITNTAGAIDVQDATVAQKGVVQIGTNIDVSSGTISVATADSTGSPQTLGLVKSGDTNNITITSGDIDVGTNIPKIGSANTFTKAQTVSKSTLTYGATINTDASTSNVFEVTLTGNATLANPTNLVSGGTYIWVVKQDATGGRTLSFGTTFKFPEGYTPSLTTTGSAIDVFSAVYDGTNLLTTFNGDFS